MEFTFSQFASPRLEWRESAGSTNAELAALASAEDLPHFTVLATANQTAGRGRLDRDWVAPAGKALAISVLLKSPASASLSVQALGWVPLLAGLGVFEMVESSLGPNSQASIKWPNDVLVGGLKVSGVLSQLLPNGAGVIVGAGINVLQTADELPVPTATSMALAGSLLPERAEAALDMALAGYLARLGHWFDRFAESGFDAEASGLRQAVKAACSTIGKPARAILPDQTELIGLATDIDSSGRLVLDVAGKLTTVAAGDIVHLRH